MQWLWPNIGDIDDASVQSRTGAAVAFLISIVTAVITYLQTTGAIHWFGHIDAKAYIDAGVFLIIGIGLRYHSRLAALAGLGLYGFEQYVMIQQYGFRFNLLALFFIIAFMNAVRGAFAYHQFKREMKKEAAATPMAAGPVSALTGLPIPQAPPPATPALEPESPRKKFPWLSLIMTLLTLVLIGIAFATFSSPGLREKVRESFGGTPNSPLAEEVEKLESEKGETAASDKDIKTFKLKSGKIISGRVIVDDPVYVTVQISSKKQEIILREDLAKE